MELSKAESKQRKRQHQLKSRRGKGLEEWGMEGCWSLSFIDPINNLHGNNNK